MKYVKFIGPMGLPAKTRRVLDAATLERLGVSVPESSLTDGALSWGPETNHTIEMSDEASESLVAKLPEQFAVVEAAGEVKHVEATIMPNPASEKPAGRSKRDKTEGDAESPGDG